MAAHSPGAEPPGNANAKKLDNINFRCAKRVHAPPDYSNFGPYTLCQLELARDGSNELFVDDLTLDYVVPCKPIDDAHAASLICSFPKVRVGAIVPLMNDVYRVAELDEQMNRIKLVRVTDSGLLKEIGIDSGSVAVAAWLRRPHADQQRRISQQRH